MFVLTLFTQDLFWSFKLLFYCKTRILSKCYVSNHTPLKHQGTVSRAAVSEIFAIFTATRKMDVKIHLQSGCRNTRSSFRESQQLKHCCLISKIVLYQSCIIKVVFFPDNSCTVRLLGSCLWKKYYTLYCIT